MSDARSASPKRDFRRKSSGKRTLFIHKLTHRQVWFLAIGLAALVVTGGKFATPVVRGWHTSEELLQMDQDYHRMVAENNAMEDQLRFSRTPEGQEVITRQKLQVVAPGEVLVNPVVPEANASKAAETPQQKVQKSINNSRREAAERIHHTHAVLKRWIVDPPEVRAERARASQKHSNKSSEKTPEAQTPAQPQ